MLTQLEVVQLGRVPHHDLHAHLQSRVTYILNELRDLFRLADRLTKLFKLVVGLLM